MSPASRAQEEAPQLRRSPSHAAWRNWRGLNPSQVDGPHGLRHHGHDEPAPVGARCGAGGHGQVRDAFLSGYESIPRTSVARASTIALRSPDPAADNPERPAFDGRARNAPRALRDPVRPRRGRDGRGLPRPRHPARPHRRDQGPAPSPRAGPRAPRPLRARGPRRLRPQPPPHLHAPRHRPAGRRRLPRHGVPRGRDARRPAAEGRPAAGPGAARRRADRRRARQGPPRRHRPPRSQARQRDAQRGRGRSCWTSAWRGWRTGPRHIGSNLDGSDAGSSR